MSSTQLLSLVGWYFLPNLAATYIQTALYTIFIRAGDPKPQPGSTRFAKDRKRTLICVILAYLCYTIYEADYQLRREGDFYQDLGIPHTATEREIQSRFRRLTVQYHPDKVTTGERAAVEAVYVQLKLARDTLTEPAKRFAYDRFGPEVLRWQQRRTVRDFVFTGVQNVTIYYVVSVSVLVLLGMLGYLNEARFWRYLVMGSLFVVELWTMTRPEFPWILTKVVNPALVTTGLRTPYLPFQFLTLLRKLGVTFFIALAQLGPLFKDPAAVSAQNGDAVPPQLLDMIDALARATDQEVSRLTGLELMPFAGDQRDRTELRSSLKEWLVQNTIRSDVEVKRAMGEALERRRRDGASGDATTADR
ncbi:DnaJ molecular chaperone homology domain [Teratosphaeria destructans]|uniref:DnaJ molecular chaperone homology domain n=1 Tax=Teratosphaeria destructans TaxID=418781 RepID=A0A9W7W5Z0_9PEZI|nr:DnaJ molecular chaperone homology domain [Teratosphaeria destructans]